MVGLLIAGIALVLFLVVFGAIRVGRQTQQAWETAATELGVDMIRASAFGNPKLTGRIGHNEVFVEVKGSGDNARTQYRLDYPPLSPNFTLKREGGAQRLLQLFTGGDAEVGDAEFDAAFAIATDSPEAVAQFLTPSMKAALTTLVAQHPNAKISNDRIEVSTKGVQRRSTTLTATLNHMRAASDALRGNRTELRGRGIPTESPADARSTYRKLRDAARELREDADLHALKEEATRAVRDPEARKDTIERLAEALGAATAGGVSATLPSIETKAAPKPQGEVGEPAAPPPPDTAEAPVRPSGDELFDDIFASRRLSFEADEVFAKKYRGNHVRWEGVVKSARPFDHDVDLGNGPGTKAVINVASVQSDLYGRAEIDAVVALPPGTRLDRGQQVVVAGVLEKADPMMRTVILGEGTLG